MPHARSIVLSPDAAASPEEAAAIVAALERFMRATAPPARPQGPDDDDGWRRAGVLEGVSREPFGYAGDPWMDMFPTNGL